MTKKLLPLILFLLSCNSNDTNPINFPKPDTVAAAKTKHVAVAKKVVIPDMKDFIKTNTYSNIAFLIDMGIDSSKYRFYVYDYSQDSIIDKGIVARGINPEFSNMPNSNATSLGKYTVGHSYIGRFGKSYRLYGLDKTNDRALERAIVLHEYGAMPYNEDSYVPYSQGCPMVNKIFYERLQNIIDNESKKILLYIYKSE